MSGLVRRYRICWVVVACLTLWPTAAPGQADTSPPSPADTARPGANRLFFAPTGRTLPGGVFEVGFYYLVVPYLTYALHDRVMLTAGTPLLPGAFGRFWYIAPKVGLAWHRWNVAGGAFVFVDIGGDPFSGREETRSLVWGVITYGSATAALTAGLTSELGTLDVFPDGGLMFVGGEYEFPMRAVDAQSVSLRLIAESYFGIPGSGPSWTTDSLNLIGFRLRSGRAAMEVVEALNVTDGEIRLWMTYPLINVSFFF